MNDTPSGSYISLTADIVSAYVSNNTVSASEIPGLISQVHSALMRVSGGPERCAARAAQAGDLGEEIDHAGSSGLPRGRQEVQIPQAPPAHAIQHDARGLPREVGASGRLPDGGPELRRRPVPARQADGPRPAAPAAREVARAFHPRTCSCRRCSAGNLICPGRGGELGDDNPLSDNGLACSWSGFHSSAVDSVPKRRNNLSPLLRVGPIMQGIGACRRNRWPKRSD